MDDLISRQAAIRIASGYCHLANIAKELSKLPSAQPDLSEYSDKLWKAAYKRGKAEAVPAWIPCSERLPKINGDYLITGRKGAVNKRKFEDGRWYGNWAVLAWMPLPEPWKGET